MFNRYRLIAILIIGWLAIWPIVNSQAEDETPGILSPIWGKTITQWDYLIADASVEYGLDPDLIAAIIFAESSGYTNRVSYAGAVGLMGVMPYAKEFPGRPNKQDLIDPTINITWGCGILTDIMRQSGGDLYASLAAYNGGWEKVNTQEPRGYAENVMNLYGQAVAVRNGVDPGIANSWEIAIMKTKGEISAELFLTGSKASSDRLPIIGELPIYYGQDRNGRPYDVRGYGIPINLVTDWKAKLPKLETIRFSPLQH